MGGEGGGEGEVVWGIERKTTTETNTKTTDVGTKDKTRGDEMR